MQKYLLELRAQASTPAGGTGAVQEDNGGEHLRYSFVAGFSILILFSAFLLDTPGVIWAGLFRIIISTSVLLSDYIAIGGPGAALFNCGLMMLLCVVMARVTKAKMNGPLLAAIFMVGGFALFGKNLFNASPILLGAYLSARYRKVALSTQTAVAFFSLAMGPLVSYLAFGLGWPLAASLPFALMAGCLAGFVLPSLSVRFMSFHHGYSLYNVGFTCGVLGMAMMAVLRALGMGSEVRANYPRVPLDGLLLIWILCLIAIIAGAGWLLSSNLSNSLREIMRQSGRLPVDFVTRFGIGPVFFNMALLGFMLAAFVLLSGGHLTGPTLGTILAVMGFAGFGKHPGNAWPLLVGALLLAFLGVWPATSDGVVIAALFATNLAPIAGTFGWPAGILAGFLHVAVTFNVNYLHGYTNLYNNGFAGGFVAAILANLFIACRRRGASRKGTV